MKKISKRMAKVLSAVLVMALLLSCVAVSGFVVPAEESNGYLVIGSSISRGYEYEGYGNDSVACYMGVKESYPCQVADALNVPTNKRYSVSYGGLTTTGTMVLLGMADTFTDRYDLECLAESYKRDLIARFGTQAQCNSLGYAKIGTDCIENIVKSCGNITLEFGLADTVMRAGFLADFAHTDFSDATAVAEFLKFVVSETKVGRETLYENLPKILDRILAWNPNATVTLLGVYNPLANLSLSDSTVLPIGSLFNDLIENLNKHYRELAEQYQKAGKQVLFVDVYNTDTPATENDVSLLNGNFLNLRGGGDNTHPSYNGLRYMAYQVLDTIGAVQNPNVKNKTDITVHMGCVKNVVGVTVNGIALKKFSFKDSVLTVTNKSKLCDTMTVITKDENGTVGLYSYDLSYDKTNGYTVHRAYSTNNLAKTATKNLNPLKKAGETIKSKLTEWFK